MNNFQCKESVVSSLDEVIQIISSDDFDNLRYHWLKSSVPSKCVNQPCILGVDEAGRGPVLGPMVYSVFYCRAEDINLLKNIGCADSKALTDKKRENIFDLINNHKDDVGWAVDIISPNFISNCMQKRVKYSLNEIAQNSTIKLIERILEKVDVKEIYVDTIGPPDKYQEKLRKLFNKCKVVVEKKADAVYAIVGAASICAKVIRDTVVSHWKFCEPLNISDKDFGTGYPGDPKSKLFLMENKDDIFGFPNIVRFSWSTANKLLENSSLVEWENLNVEETAAKNFSSYFKASATHEMKNSFFKERSLNVIDNF